MSDPSPQPGTPLHGPGGLLGTPGLGTRRKGRKWGQRLKAKQIVGNLYRGDNGKFQAGSGGGTSGATPARGRQLSKQPPIKTAKPVKTAAPKKGRAAKKPAGAKPKDPAVAARQQQRDQEHTQDRAQRQVDRQARLARQAQRDQEHAADRQARLQKQQAGAAKRQQTALDALTGTPKPAKVAASSSGGSKKPSADDKRREQSQRAIDTAGEVGLQTRDLEDLRQAAAGLGGVNNPAMTKLGLIGADGLTTDQGRRALSALERGDVRQYRAAVQDAQARQDREAAAAQRKQQTEGRRAGAQAERNAAKQRQLDRLKRRAQGGASLSQAQRDQLTDAGMAEDDGQMWRLKQASFAVFKDHTGAHRWIARTTTAYRDRDGEIISTKALEADAARMTATGQYGPLRWHHVGEPDPFNTDAPWGPGLDIGDCDFSIVIGRTSVESGTFKSAAIGDAFAESADEFELSPGFFHPLNQPDADGVFDDIRRFERSTVPIKHGRASNLFTGLTVKEHRMDPQVYNKRVQTYLDFAREKGVPPEVAAANLNEMARSDKSAADQAIAFKSDDAPPDPWLAVVAALKAALQPEQAAEKAAPPPVDQEMAAIETQAADDMPMDELEPEGDESGMDDGQIVEAIAGRTADILMKRLTPLFGDMKMSEFKTLLSSYATKDDSRAQEITTLKSALSATQAQQTELAQRLALLEGDQPAVTRLADAEAALKSAGPTAPATPDDPEVTEALNDPSRPYAGLAARTMPALYRNTPDGGFAGWQPPAAP